MISPVANQRRWPRLDAVLVDLRHAGRGLRGAPGLAAAAVLTLGVGIGFNVAVFTVANATLFKGYRGVPASDRLVYVTTGADCCVSYQDLLDWSATATSLAGMGAVADLRVAVQPEERSGSETATATEISPTTFSVLQVQPTLGRDFTRGDAAPGAPPTAILSHDYWRTRFAADPAVVGRSIRVNGAITTVIGVMPPRFAFPQYQELWLPLVPTPTRLPRDARGLWFAVARLADGVTVDDARSELATIGARLAAAHPATNARVRPVVQTFRELFFGHSAVAVYGALWGAVSLVLLVACANLANLLLARAAGRTRETAVRLALGASRGRIVRQMLFESTMLSAAGGVLGWWVAGNAVRVYDAIAVPPTQPWARQMLDYAIDLRVLAYLVAISLAAGVLFGLLPALRLSALDVQAALRDGGRGAVGSITRRRLTGAIVVAQVALAVVLLSGAGVLVRSLLAVYGRDVGFDPAHVAVALTTRLPESRYPDAAAQRAFYDRLIGRLEALPQVEAIGFSDGMAGQGARRLPIESGDRPTTDDRDRPIARVTTVGGRYFAALGASMSAGRAFDARDERSSEPVAVVNRRLAATLWPTADAVGRRIRLRPAGGGTPGPWRTVVGVVPDLRQGDPARAEIDPAVYVPMQGQPALAAWVLVRSGQPAGALVAPMRRALQAADPELPIWLGPYP